MGRRFKITEEQYKQALAEGVTIAADVSAANGDVKKAVDTAKDEATKNGMKLSDTSIEVPANYNEGRLYTKRQLQENYRRRLKENSRVYTVGEFMEMLKERQK